MAGNERWELIKRLFPTPVRAMGEAFGDKAPAPGDDSIAQVDDPFTNALGSGLALGAGRAAKAAAPQIERLIADEVGGIVKPKIPPKAPELSMEELPRKMRAIEMGFDPTKTYYHGTKADIDAFDPKALGATTNAGSAKQGYFFASDPSTASDYSNLSSDRDMLQLKRLEAAGQEVPDSLYERAYREPKKEIFGAEDRLKTHIRNNPDQALKNVEQLKQSIQSVEDILSGKKTEKYPRPRDYLESKLADYKKYLSDSEKLSSYVGRKEWEYNRDALQRQYDEIKGLVEAGDNLGSNVNPVHLKMENPYVHDYKGADYRDEKYADIMKKAKELGHDSVVFKNTYDPVFSHNRVKQDIVAVFEPNQIRSKFAAFDPAKKDSSNLSAALAGVGIGAGAMATKSNEAQASDFISDEDMRRMEVKEAVKKRREGR
jgi:hypothetical protein